MNPSSIKNAIIATMINHNIALTEERVDAFLKIFEKLSVRDKEERDYYLGETSIPTFLLRDKED